jgi:hypothetical protein
VETGTYRGDTLVAVSDLFEQLHSVEIDPELHRLAVERFRGEPNVTLHLGDSGEIIHQIIRRYNEPILFWLDGHASGGETGTGKKYTPIVEELKAIANHPVKTHVILIDDAMDFGVEIDYPPLSKLKSITKIYPGFINEEHIIRITNLAGINPFCSPGK